MFVTVAQKLGNEPLNPGSRESGIESCCCRFEDWDVSVAYCFSSVNYMNKYLAVDVGGYLCTNILCVVIAAWLIVILLFYKINRKCVGRTYVTGGAGE